VIVTPRSRCVNATLVVDESTAYGDWGLDFPGRPTFMNSRGIDGQTDRARFFKLHSLVVLAKCGADMGMGRRESIIVKICAGINNFKPAENRNVLMPNLYGRYIDSRWHRLVESPAIGSHFFTAVDNEYWWPMENSRCVL
jgi:hypothetical protein